MLQDECERFAISHLADLLDTLWQCENFSEQARVELFERMREQCRMALKESRI